VCGWVKEEVGLLKWGGSRDRLRRKKRGKRPYLGGCKQGKRECVSLMLSGNIYRIRQKRIQCEVRMEKKGVKQQGGPLEKKGGQMRGASM